MKLSNFIKTNKGQLQLTKLQTYLNIGLTGALLLLSMMVFDKKPVVVIQPFTLTEDAQVTDKEASQNYLEAWGLCFAQLFGNITPSNIDFVIERTKIFLSPRIYNNTISLLEEKAADIIVDGVTLSFLPREVTYEKETNKVFVSGTLSSSGAGTDKPELSYVTYEFVITISNYIPVIQDMNTYQGKALTKQEILRTSVMKTQQDKAK